MNSKIRPHYRSLQQGVAIYIYIYAYNLIWWATFRLQKFKKQRERWKTKARKGKDWERRQNIEREKPTSSVCVCFFSGSSFIKTWENWKFDFFGPLIEVIYICRKREKIYKQDKQNKRIYVHMWLKERATEIREQQVRKSERDVDREQKRYRERKREREKQAKEIATGRGELKRASWGRQSLAKICGL